MTKSLKKYVNQYYIKNNIMSKFQPIQTNRFGTVQHRSLKQVLEQHKQEIERMKEHKCEPSCVQQYDNPFKLSDHQCNNPAIVCVTEESTIQSDDECKLTDTNEEKSNDDLPLHDHPHVHIEMPVIYDTPKTNDDIKPVEVETEVENIKTELKKKQSFKDVVKLSYKHFLQKEFSV